MITSLPLLLGFLSTMRSELTCALIVKCLAPTFEHEQPVAKCAMKKPTAVIRDSSRRRFRMVYRFAVATSILRWQQRPRTFSLVFSVQTAASSNHT